MQPCRRVIRQFCETTTLHGFKYLFSKYYCDRIGWLICCCASGCCAAVLCTVVWARFMQVPALLTLVELYGNPSEVEMPLVAICPPVDLIAEMFVKRFKVNKTTATQLPKIFNRLLRRKYMPEDQLDLVAEILDQHELTFTQALYEVMPECEDIIVKCQWQKKRLPCRRLFDKDLTQWGICCVAKSDVFKSTKVSRMESTRRMSLALQCHDKLLSPNCYFYTKYDVEEWFEPIPLAQGYHYEAQMTFVSVQDKDPNKLLDGTCASHQFYSRSRCLLKCIERRCGCLDVIRLSDDPAEAQPLHTCPLRKLNCLRSLNRDNNTCNCSPTCKKVSTSLILDSSPMSAFRHTIDNF
ncbi:unnamed protein product [Leptosia nina]|uniref:Sodium channel protein Nach n=1 Tax=Leptosia nina TaxID=320188 RepID=A0AAV1JTJ8_9NEOP